ncbi:LANO_0F14686g1_1 [Lachancea nothofagi CBS 11611]|uniref:Guanosine-diphosphatase n=1 Tax=Lachancea nothofagi CBS 11611 TaxID=1266666 RepID=A0A1G4KCB7_9SACH|nr:LANO_0F14686g1_1 [Lachancea nothofagi CBS 11611]
MAGLGAIVRNYRFVIGSLTAVMLILLLRSSSGSSGSSGVILDSSKEEGGTVNVLPIVPTPGYIDDANSQSKNPDVADAVKESLKQSPDSKYSNAPCDKPHQYVIMVDAGSTGSRIHIYEFDVCTQPASLLHETFKMLKPGLSHFDTDAKAAALSLDELLDKALEVIPKERQGCSPVAVKATAGLRMLGEAKSDKILQAVQTHLETDYPFPVVAKDGVVLMSGEEEGVYAWITANFLLGNIGAGSKLPTAATFDLGGGSTQIVFEPSYPPNEMMLDGEYKYPLSFADHDYTLYQFSHLGYGLMEGRNKVNALLVETALKDGLIEKSNKSPKLSSPCLPPGTVASDVKVTLENGDEYLVTFKGPVTPAGAQCRFLADKILKKDAACTSPPCSFNGVHQPSLVRTFKETNDLYVFSYFYDKTQPLGLPHSFTLGELADVARMVCNGEDVWESVFSGIEGSIAELKKEPLWCLDLSFQFSLLHTGYDIPLYRELKTADKIANNELGWCLGASLPLLDGKDWKCKSSKS